MIKPLSTILLVLPLLAGCDPYCKGDPNGSWECWLKGQPSAGGSATSGAPPAVSSPSAPATVFCQYASSDPICWARR